MRDGKRVLRYLSADPASQATCATCHNSYEKRPDVVALRNANGVQIRKLLQTEAILHRSQAELARSEANATNTTLAASVSHELSTPLGNSLMTSSNMVEQGRSFEKLLNSNQLTRSSLAGFVQGILEGNDLIVRNLYRADELLQNFRQVANDQTSEQRRSFDLAITVQEILATSAPTLKSNPNRMVMDIDCVGHHARHLTRPFGSNCDQLHQQCLSTRL